jgi:hypothetical protein
MKDATQRIFMRERAEGRHHIRLIFVSQEKIHGFRILFSNACRKTSCSESGRDGARPSGKN